MAQVQNSQLQRYVAFVLLLVTGGALVLSLMILLASLGVSAAGVLLGSFQMVIGSFNLWICYSVFESKVSGRWLWIFIGLSLVACIPYTLLRSV